jgi:hypothetical protein
MVIFDTFGHSGRKKPGHGGAMTILVRHRPDVGTNRGISINLNRVRESIWNRSICFYLRALQLSVLVFAVIV